MSRKLSIAGTIAVGATIALALVVFLVFNASFGGPSLTGQSPPFRLIAHVPDAQNLIGKSLVLTRGVHVGEAQAVKLAGGRVRVTLAVDPDKAVAYRDATVQVGRRTLFGEAYVRLDPGRPRAGRLPSGSVLRADSVLPSVGFDEALTTLNRPTREHLSSVARTGAGVAAGARSAARINRTLAELSRVLSAARRVNGALAGQEGNLRAFVQNTTKLTGRLASREQAIRSLVGDGRATLEAVTADAGQLSASVNEAGRLLGTARGTLSSVRPLIDEATPVVDGLTDAAPSVRRALHRLPATSRALHSATAALPALTAAAVPTLRQARALGVPGRQALAALEPALRDVVPMLRYAGPYGRDLVGFFGVGAGALRRLDDKGYTVGPDIPFVKTLGDWYDNCVDPNPCAYGRFNIGPIASSPVGAKSNPYSRPGDSTSPWSGTYPRLTPEPLPTTR